MTRVLVLVPTEFELRKLQPLIADSVAEANGIIMTCGLGPIVAGVTTAQLLAKVPPTKVVLAGISGAIGPRFSIGTAASFSRVACYGIGAGAGSEFQTRLDSLERSNDNSGIAGYSSVAQRSGIVSTMAQRFNSRLRRRFRQLYRPTSAADRLCGVGEFDRRCRSTQKVSTGRCGGHGSLFGSHGVPYGECSSDRDSRHLESGRRS